MSRRSTATMLAVALLASCSKPSPEPEGEASSVPAASEAAAEPDAMAQPANFDSIPEALRGNWGISAADCDTSTGAAKGNLEVSADSLTFYESVGKLGRIDSLSKVGIGATFDFTGEGQTWQTNMVLSVSPDGKTLTREDRGPEGMPEPLTYQRCGA